MEFLSQLHPKLVHFPIALFCTFALLEAAAFFIRKEWLANASLLILTLGVVTSIAALLTGNQSAALISRWQGFLSASGIKNVLEVHEQWATICVWYFTAILTIKSYFLIQWKIKKRFLGIQRKLSAALLLLAITGCIFVFLAGIYGGELVYKYGAGTELMNKELKNSNK